MKSSVQLTAMSGQKSCKDKIGRRLRNEMDHKGIEVSILFPCRNEEVTIQHCLKEAEISLRNTKVRGELVVVGVVPALRTYPSPEYSWRVPWGA
jgi:hypothetical protein